MLPLDQMNNLVKKELDGDEEIMRRRIAAAQKTCRQRRIAAYIMLVLYAIIAIYVFRFRRQKEI